MSEAIEDYRHHLRRKGNLPKSYDETARRLYAFFPEGEERVSSLNTAKCEKLYDALADSGLSVDSHRNYLAEAKTFLAWCRNQGWIGSNPLAEIKGVGKRKKGKDQLYTQESRKWADWAIWRASRGDEGALAAAMALMMGLRASEITKRTVRDLDDGGNILRITAAKTEKGNRIVEVPDVLREPLLALTRDKLPAAPLFFSKRGGGHYRPQWVNRSVKRVCRTAEVPEITAHGLRGTHSSIAQEAGATAHVVAAALGHESTRTTTEHYTNQQTVTAAHQRKVVSVLKGGRR